MNYCSSEDAIIVVKGNDTNFNGQTFLRLYLTGILDLSDFSATFTICGLTKTFDDISSGEIEINYSAAETTQIPFGRQNGVLKLIDNSHRIATIESLIPFNFISVVHGNAIATRPYEMTFNVEQGGENILNISVEAGVSVEVGETETLPAGSDAYVQNVGTQNHLVLNFGIPEGEKGEQGKDGEPGKDATINGRSAIILAAGTGIAISDNQGTVTISNTQTSAEWGNITGDIANQQDLQQALSGKQNTISDLSEIRSGAEAGATALQPSDVVNTTGSTATNKPLSANMGKSLQDQIDNLSARGRFLALWNCATGLAESNPPESPYTYKTGDYFIVGTVASGGGTNYRPSGASYTTGVASTTVETEAVGVDDVYYYDGTNWRLQINTGKSASFATIAGDPYDNTNLAAALNAKQDELVQGTGISIDSDTNTISNSGVRGISTGATNGTISVNTNGTSAEVAVAGLGSAAYTASTDYATSAQGSLADTAVQPGDLGTAAYAATTDFATSQQGAKADSAIQGVQLNGTTITPDANKIVNVQAAQPTIIREWIG